MSAEEFLSKLTVGVDIQPEPPDPDCAQRRLDSPRPFAADAPESYRQEPLAPLCVPFMLATQGLAHGLRQPARQDFPGVPAPSEMSIDNQALSAVASQPVVIPSAVYPVNSQSDFLHRGVWRSGNNRFDRRSAPYPGHSSPDARFHSDELMFCKQQPGITTANPLELTRDEYAKFKRVSSRDALIYIAEHYADLLAAGLERDNIIKIASNAGAVQALQAVSRYRRELTEAGVSTAAIVKMARKADGAQTLQVVATCHRVLTEVGFSRADIVKIAGNGGAQALLTVINRRGELIDNDFSIADMVKIARNGGGARALNAVITYRPALIKRGFSNANIVTMASNTCGEQVLQAVIDHGQALTANGFSNDDIVKIAGNIRGARALEAVVDYGPVLTTNGFSNDDIVSVAGNQGGALALRALLDEWTTLVEAGHTKALIMKAATKKTGGAVALRQMANPVRVDHL